MSHWQLIKESSQHFNESDRDRAGRHGEEQVGSCIKKFQGLTARGIYSFHALRVPQSQSKGKYEIDYLVVSSQGVLLIEVKNLGGFIQQDKASGDWLQKKSSGKSIVHKNPLSLLDLKKKSVQKFLENKGFAYAPEHFEAVLINTNKNLVLSKELAKDRRLVSNETLIHYLNSLVRKKRFLFFPEPPRLINFKGALKALQDLPTWDEVRLNGGSVVRGDIIKMASKLNFRPSSSSLFLFMPRSKIWGWFVPPTAVVHRKQNKLAVRCVHISKPMDHIHLRPAGKNGTELIKVCHIKSIHFGY